METRSLTILEDARCSASSGFCDHCQIRDIAFCAAMRDEEINELSRISLHKNYHAGEIIYDLGDKIERYANIIDGTVKLTKLLSDGRQQIIGFLFPGDFVGKIFAEQHTCYVEAVTDVHLCSFAQGDLRKIIKSHPDVNNRLFLNCTRSLERAEEWMLLLGRKTALEKLASFIMLLSSRNAERGLDPDLVQLPMSRADIADFLGLTIETVSRQITKLKTQQKIRLEVGNNISIIAREEMEDLAGSY